MTVDIPNFKNVHALVVGDVMLDRYWQGQTHRISPEAPIPVVTIEKKTARPGGAANVAVNLARLGCQVSLFGFVGRDEAAECLRQTLEEAGVETHFHVCDAVSTTTKLRVTDRNQQLIRLDLEAATAQIMMHAKTPAWLSTYMQGLSAANVVILSDYGKGALAQPAHFIVPARKKKIPVVVDPNYADFKRYLGATVIKPNRKEFEDQVRSMVGPTAEVGPMPMGQLAPIESVPTSEAKSAKRNKASPADPSLCRNPLQEKAIHLLQRCDCQALLITCGSEGMTLVQRCGSVEHFPAHKREIYDVTGAGDTVTALLAASLAAKASLSRACSLANIAAGIVVGKAGAATVSLPELRRALQRQENSGLGVLNEDMLQLACEDARAHGERIIMTNGCFDLLHAGHVAYLEQAKSLGHRLLVAVNDDQSVRRLKGKTRPIHEIAHRMQVLAALRAVDWVVSFCEDTPERLIHRISPDILVKAADYTADEIAGAPWVIAKGGAVKIIPLYPPHSTSATIERIVSLSTDISPISNTVTGDYI